MEIHPLKRKTSKDALDSDDEGPCDIATDSIFSESELGAV